MTPTSANERRILRRLTELTTLRAWGTLSDARIAELERLVIESEFGQRVYFDLMLEQAALGRLSAESDVALLNELGIAPGEANSAAAVEMKRPRRFLSMRSFALAASIALVFWSAAASWLFTRWMNEQPTTVVVKSVGTFEGGEDCEWEQTKFAVGDSMPAKLLHLTRGIAQIRLTSGVRLVLEAPTSLNLELGNRVRLLDGKLAARVEKSAIGFAVETPTTTVVDLGTEFGVQVDKQGTTDVQVFDGKVSIKTNENNDSDATEARPETLVAGQSRRVEKSAATGKFVVTVPAKAPSIRRSVTAAVVAKDGKQYPKSLVAYWRFDEKDGPAWDERNACHATLVNAERVPGLVGAQGVRFTGQPDSLIRVSDHQQVLCFTEAFTIEASFTLAWDGAGNTFCSILRKEHVGMPLLLAFQNDANRETHSYPTVADGQKLAFGLTVGGKYHELEMLLDGQAGRPTLKQLADGKPHHVAATYDAASGRKAIYLDGRCVAEFVYPEDERMFVVEQGTTALGNAPGGGEAFTGILDEVAIYRSALSAHDVKQHFQNITNLTPYFPTGEQVPMTRP